MVHVLAAEAARSTHGRTAAAIVRSECAGVLPGHVRRK